MLTARALHDNLAQAGHAKFDVLDWSSLIAGTRVAAGLDGFDNSKVGYEVFPRPYHGLTFS